MKIGRSVRKTWLVWFGSLLAVVGVAATAVINIPLLNTEETPNVPTVFNSDGTPATALFGSGFNTQTHFLVFEGSDTAGESVATENAYYDAIDPRTQANNFQGSKREFTQWLVNAGFIKKNADWTPTGKQLVACDLGSTQGCDLTSAQYNTLVSGGTVTVHGVLLNSTYNIINTDSHVIVLNAGDLGFVRNQFIRCVPSCTASSNPIIYSYLENYPVNAFSGSGYTANNNHPSGFPFVSGYPTQAEAKAAMQSALNRPADTLATHPNPVNGQTCQDTGATPVPPNTVDTVLGCSIARIADVAFEWAPPPGNLSSSTRYGQLYAYIFDAKKADPSKFQETIALPQPTQTGVCQLCGFPTPNLATRNFNTNPNGSTHLAAVGEPFAPNLDFIGFKEHPGNCLICHGGKPQNLVNGKYPNNGLLAGFRFLPLDIRNLLFTSDGDLSDPISRISQEAQIKEYNKAVLLTVDQTPERDDEGTLRPPHLAEIIKGWYAGFLGDQNMTGQFQRDFTPKGWREPKDGGTAPTGSEALYKNFVAPTCRSCHFNRELSADFGTAANFIGHGADTLNYVLLPQCLNPNGDKGFRPMPLAHLTLQRLWQTNHATQILPSGADGPLSLTNLPDNLADYFGYNGVADYCNSIH